MQEFLGCGTCTAGYIHLCCDLSPQDLSNSSPHPLGGLTSELRPGTPHGRPTSYLLTASHHAAAEVAAGLGVDHGGDVLLALEVCEVELSPLGLLPVGPRCPVTHHPAVAGWEDGQEAQFGDHVVHSP